jgi:hypothetical protein
MSLPILLAVIVALGVALLVASNRATANVQRGRIFVRWMLVAFLAYIGLAALPILIGS